MGMKQLQRTGRWVSGFLCLLFLFLTILGGPVWAQEDSIVRVVFFTAPDCPHCQAVKEDVLKPLQAQYGDRLAIRTADVSDPANYELLLQAEEMFTVSAEERGLPTLVVGGEVFIGEDTIRQELPCFLETCLAQGGTEWPDIPGLERLSSESGTSLEDGFDLGETVEGCDDESAGSCEVPVPIWAAYFYEVGCQVCSRVEYDIRYVEERFPQLVVREYNVQERAALAEWLGEEVGVPEEERLSTPAIFIGDDYLIGSDITADALSRLLEKYRGSGAEQTWADFDPEMGRQNIIERFKSFGPLTVAFAGLVDGLNPCAFATLVFFVSYLALSGREGKEILSVGIAFTGGVFLAYLVVGLGFYQVLDLLGDWLTRVGRWVYGLTGVICAGLAIFSFLDFVKARRGEIGDMALNLPHGLRMRINKVIRERRSGQAFVIGSFFTGIIVSFLELACTGQVYLPTIIFVVSQPDLRVRAALFLIIYNLLFILPLVVVFILAYYGTGSKELTHFLKRHAATVKLGMTILFAALATWLLTSVVVQVVG